MARVPRDDYYVIMWNYFDPLYSSGAERAALAIRRYREMGCNAGTCMATFVNLPSYRKSIEVFGLPPGSFRMEDYNDYPFGENKFPFYVMNCCRPFYWNWGEAKPLFRRWYEEFHATRNRKLFVRPDCVNNPKVMETMKSRIGDIVAGLKKSLPLALLYDLRDEPSITSFVLAADLCFCEHCMRRMREWLEKKCGDLDGLNAAWGTAFSSWSEVEPLTTEEALDRRQAGNWNFAPWADHRTFMNDTFARACVECAAELKKHDREALAGICGTQCPSVFGGYDFYKLGSILDWYEPYDFGNSVDCLRSFKKGRHVAILKTSGLGGGVKARRAMLWHYLLQSGGHGGTILWQSNEMFDVESKAIRPKARTREFGGLLQELRTGVPRLLQLADEVSSPVAVHYSQASILADFITSVPNRWRSIAGWYDEKGGVYRAREAWWKLLEDKGLRPVFLATPQVESGELLRRGVRLFVLPRSIAISDGEAREMAKFVDAGGVLVADSFAGRMNEHCRERAVGVIDELLGIRRLEHDNYHWSDEQINLYSDWKGTKFAARQRMTGCQYIEELVEPVSGATVMGRTELTDSPLGIVTRRGRGRTLLCNAVPVNYEHHRRTGGGPTETLFGCAVEMAMLEPLFRVSAAGRKEPMAGWRLFEFRHGPNRYFGASADIGVTQDILGAIEVADEKAKRGGARLIVRFPAAGHIHEVTSGKYLGRGKQCAVRLSSFDVPIFAVMASKAKAMKLAFDGTKATARLVVSGGKPGERVFRFDLFDSRGRRQLDSGANVAAANGEAEWAPDSALPKKGKLVCRDVASGVKAAVRLR